MMTQIKRNIYMENKTILDNISESSIENWNNAASISVITNDYIDSLFLGLI